MWGEELCMHTHCSFKDLGQVDYKHIICKLGSHSKVITPFYNPNLYSVRPAKILICQELKNLLVRDQQFVGSDLTFSNPVKTNRPVETVQLRTWIKWEVTSLSDRCYCIILIQHWLSLLILLTMNYVIWKIVLVLYQVCFVLYEPPVNNGAHTPGMVITE